jgi:hypothetical protein
MGATAGEFIAALDLIITKLNTGRDKDLNDTRHLESIIRERYRAVLPTASIDEVKHLFNRFLDWEVCQMTLETPTEDVRNFAFECLREMAAEGDPFSLTLLDDCQIPYSTG